MTDTLHPALRGPWVAVLNDDDGFVVDLDDARLLWGDCRQIRISVVRGDAVPVGQRMTDCATTDVLYTVDDDVIEVVNDDDLVNRWEQAQTVAAQLNMLGGQS
jgi:hypothetical protein